MYPLLPTLVPQKGPGTGCRASSGPATAYSLGFVARKALRSCTLFVRNEITSTLHFVSHGSPATVQTRISILESRGPLRARISRARCAHRKSNLVPRIAVRYNRSPRGWCRCQRRGLSFRRRGSRRCCRSPRDLSLLMSPRLAHPARPP